MFRSRVGAQGKAGLETEVRNKDDRSRPTFFDHDPLSPPVRVSQQINVGPVAAGKTFSLVGDFG